MVTPPREPPDFVDVFRSMEPEQMLLALDAAARERVYVTWDKLRHLSPPDGLTHEQWWAGIKVGRAQQARELPLVDGHGRPFTYTLPDALLEQLDDITRRASGTVGAPELVVNPATRDRYLVNSLMEESITSSQLEGAVTTQRVAKEMLRTGRPPRDISERMIVNNYEAMRFIRAHVADDLTPSLVGELHSIITSGTLQAPSAAGRPQLPGETRVGVWSVDGGTLLHDPPPAEELPARLARLCRFANGEAGERWMHPVLRAIITHFMVGFDHYFVDGNGRTARALFYWVVLRNEYWLLEYVTISRILRDAPAQYARAYLHTEVDGGDVTHFALHQVGVIRRALDDLHGYLERKMGEVVRASSTVARLRLNHRQSAIVEGSLRGRVHRITATSHATSHDVALATARADLRGLERLGLITSHVEGRQQVWMPVQELPDRLESLTQ